MLKKDHEKSIRWNDTTLDIKWPTLESEYIISEKDASAKIFKEIFNKNSEK